MRPFLYKNKGTYGHFGGILHALIHSMGTFVVLVFFTPVEVALLLSYIDGLFHYHIDWAKMNIGAKFGLKPDNSEWFWILLGFDQLLHFLTYYLIVRLV